VGGGTAAALGAKDRLPTPQMNEDTARAKAQNSHLQEVRCLDDLCCEISEAGSDPQVYSLMIPSR
jgi:hypothetical protein